MVELEGVTHESGAAVEAVGQSWTGLNTGYDKMAYTHNLNRRIRNRTYGGVRDRLM